MLLYSDCANDLRMKQMMGIENRWLSVDEIAGYLGVKRETVYKWIERKNMPAHKVGRLWKFKTEEIDRWVRKDRVGNGDPDSVRESGVHSSNDKSQ